MVPLILELFAFLVVVSYFLCDYTMTAASEMMILFKIPSAYLTWTISDHDIPPYLGGREERSTELNGTGEAVLQSSKGNLFLDIRPEINHQLSSSLERF